MEKVSLYNLQYHIDVNINDISEEYSWVGCYTNKSICSDKHIALHSQVDTATLMHTWSILLVTKMT